MFVSVTLAVTVSNRNSTIHTLVGSENLIINKEDSLISIVTSDS